jgi:CheY-like chemotaxis protein
MVEKARVLISEDDVIQRRVLAAVLEDAGFEVVLADNGRVALDLAREVKPQVVITDIMMPLIDGVQMSRMLRREPDFAATPFLFLTSYPEISPAQSVVVGAHDHYLTKPVDLPVVVTLVTSMVEQESREMPVRPEVTAGLSPENQYGADWEESEDRNTKLAVMFSEQFDSRLEELRRVVAADHPGKVAEVSHFLAENAHVLGALRLAEICAKIEHIGKRGELSGVKPLLTALEIEFERITARFRPT